MFEFENISVYRTMDDEEVYDKSPSSLIPLVHRVVYSLYHDNYSTRLLVA